MRVGRFSGWNKVTKESIADPRLAFGDIDLSAGPGDKWPQTDIRTSPSGNDMLIGKPQTGGWPAHRYFNSSTGLDGKPYPRQTEEQMCEVRQRTHSCQQRFNPLLLTAVARSACCRRCLTRSACGTTLRPPLASRLAASNPPLHSIHCG